MKGKEKFKTNTLYWYANEFRKNITEESEIEKIDMTETFYKELEYMIKNGEIIIININGKVRLGKSTEAMAIGKSIWKLLQKYKHRKKREKFGHKNIARDQQEYSKWMRDPKTNNTVIVTDESNELENTGENVTVERALNQTFSDVQAARYVHRVCCSPKENIDPNADILLSVVSTDKQKKTTHNKLYYRYYEGGMEHIQILGYVNIHVGEIIKTWEKIKPIFYKSEPTKKEEELIEETAKKDWYTNYVIKKHEKMELITKEGIFKPRLLDYAKVINQIIDRMRKLCREPQLVNNNLIRNYVRMHMRQEKIPQSIIGEQLVTNEVMGIIDLWKSYFKTNRDLQKIENQKEKLAQEDYERKKRQIEELRREIQRTICMQQEEYEHYEKINYKYHDHL